MSAPAHSAADEDEKTIVISRLIKAPRELVFAAFSDPEHITNWWGPNGFTTTTHKMSFEPGGKWVFTMHGPDGTDYANMIIYRSITAPVEIVYDHYSGEDGPLHFKGHTTFENDAGATRVTLRLMTDSAAKRAEFVKFGAVEGGEQTLARLEAHVAGKAKSA